MSVHATNPSLVAALDQDIMDSHSYFDYPSKLGAEGTITNLNPYLKGGMVGNGLSEGAGIIASPASNSVQGKPFFLSEVNWSYPNEYQYLFLPMLTSYASFQDWDGIVLHAYSLLETPDDSSRYIEAQTMIHNNQLLMSQNVSCAIMYREGYIASSQAPLALTYNKERVAEELPSRFVSYNHPPKQGTRIPPFPFLNADGSLGHVRPDIVYVHGFRKKFSNVDDRLSVDITAPYLSDTKEILFDVDHDQFSAHSSRVLLIAGRVETPRSSAAGESSLEIDSSQGSAAFTLASMDGKEIDKSKQILLTAVSQVSNTGAVFSADRTSAMNWGHEPVLLKKIYASVTIKGLSAAKYQVYTLDSHGNEDKLIYRSKESESVLHFRITYASETPWFYIVQM